MKRRAATFLAVISLMIPAGPGTLASISGGRVAGAGGGAVTDAAVVPSDAVEFEGHHYQIFDDVDGLSWTSGRDTCVALGGHLAVVTSRGEAEFVGELCDGAYLFLGASDSSEEGTWVWVDGSPFEFTWWLDGQPNDYTGAEDYLATYDGGRWVDVDHQGDDFWMPTGFICEWEAAE